MSGSDPFLFHPIGRIQSQLRAPAEAPRQAVYGARNAFLAWVDPRKLAPAAEDLQGVERIWLIFVFDRNLDHHWKPKVRPPLSSGGRRRGVLATRSPHRPNPIGLSAVELLSVTPEGLELGSCDLLDGTPVLDVKPYIPAADAFPNSRAGWRDAVREDPYNVVFTPEALAQIAFLREHGGPDLENFCRVQLAVNPGDRRRKRLTAPGANDDLWSIACRTWRLRFRRDDAGRVITVMLVRSGYAPEELFPGADDPFQDKDLHRAFREFAARSGENR